MNQLISKLESLVNEKRKLEKNELNNILKEIKNQEKELLKIGVFDPIVNQKQEYVIFYEMICFILLISEDMNNFELYFKRLRHFYEQNSLASHNLIHLMGIFLIHLFSTNKFNEFNIILESLSDNDKNNNHIEFVSKLSNLFKIGSYNSALEYSKNPPSELYKSVTNRIIETIRIEIFKNILSTIEEIELLEIMNLLEINNKENLDHFLKNISNILPEEKWFVNNEKLFIEIKKNKYECNFDYILKNSIEQIKDFDQIFS